MKKILLSVSLVFIGTLAGIAQQPTDIKIVSEDQRSIVLEFTPKIQTEQVLGTHGTVFTRFRFFNSHIEYDSTGRAIFFRSVLMALPSTEHSLQVVESEFHITDTIKLLPKPKIKFLDEFGIVESYDEEEYNRISGVSTPKTIAELVGIGRTSLGNVGTLILRPIQLIDRDRVKIYTRIVVKLEFKNPLPAGVLSSAIFRGGTIQNRRVKNFSKISSSRTTFENSPFAQGDWYRIEVKETGMYKLSYNYFNQLNIVVNDINSIRLYGNGGVAIPDDADDIRYPRPNTLLEIPRLIVDRNGDGKLDIDDYVIFYGRGVRRWIYKGSGSFQHIVHPYTEKNYYFLTFNQGIGRDMDTISGLIINPTDTSRSFQEKIFIEQERYNLINSGRRWYGKLFSGSDNVDTYYNALPGLIDTMPVNYRFSLLHRSSTSDRLDIYENSQQLYSAQMPATNLADDARYGNEVSAAAARNGGVPNNSSVIRIQVNTGNQEAKTWLNWLEIFYQRKYEARSGEDMLLFTTADKNGFVRYDVSNLSAEVRAFDITVHDSVKQITQLEFSPACSFQLQQQAGTVREVAVIGNNGYKVPLPATRIENSNIHGAQIPIDFIIISPKEFMPEANRLKSYRESHDSLSTIVVDINQVYNEFSGGIPDPLAIREFLRYAKNNWFSISATSDTLYPYVLLFGGGHYDFKNLITNERNWIPPYESDESLLPTVSGPCDDQFVIFNYPYCPSMAIGRLPVRNINEARIVIDKIISYESTSPVDTWRNRITFVADDGKTSTTDEGNIYTRDSEDLVKIYTPESFERKKIYIVEYPTVNSALGRRKPDVNKAIVDAINGGTLIINYIGHGNERLLAHESIFTQQEDIPRLTNRNLLTLVFAATCYYGRFDDFSYTSSAEQLLTMEQGGAVADISAARAVYDDRNVALNKSYFDYQLNKDTDTGDFLRLGDAWLKAKLDNYSSWYRDNTQKFHLFGDPTLKLLIPQNKVSIDSVGGGSPKDSTIAIRSLDHVKIVGVVRQKNGTPMSSFNGRGLLQLFDSKKVVNISEGGYLFEYDISGSQLYSGEVSINNGQFSALVPIPKDVTYGQKARISIYMWGDQIDGVGCTDSIKIAGINTTAEIDTVGPRISIYLDDYLFHSGNVVKNNPMLIVRLEDESGINTSTAGVGHQLTAAINNPERNIDISSYYRSNIDTYKSGEVRYQLKDLNDGKHTLDVKAWDIQNNLSEAEISFEVNATDNLVMLNVLNYPNPFSSSTTFTFQRNTTDLIDVEVKIYTVTGRLIYVLTKTTAERYVKIPWDGRDNEGAFLANGIYFYKVIARSQQDQRSCETIGKMAIMR